MRYDDLLAAVAVDPWLCDPALKEKLERMWSIKTE
jgi:hypothetical protein